MNTKKTVSVLVGISVSCLLVVAALSINYIRPEYDKGTTNSLGSIKELKGMLDSFPSIGEIKYVRRIQAGTVGIFFTGKALPDEVERFCEREGCVVSPAKEYQKTWQDRLVLYKAQESFFVSCEEGTLHFDGPESLRNNRYRISFLYMPNEQVFIGEFFFFR